MRATTDGSLVVVEFDIPGFGSGAQYLTVDQADALREQLGRAIEVADE